MLSLGMLAARALSITRRRRGLPFGSPPPIRAAVAISRISLVKTFPRLASIAPFLRRMVAHLEWPDMAHELAREGRSVQPGVPEKPFESPGSGLRLGLVLPIRDAVEGPGPR